MKVSNDFIKQEYFDYILKLVHADGDGEFYNYTHLMYRLWQYPYRPGNQYDSNRASDGVDFRYYSFAYDMGLPYELIDESSIYNMPCSVLEMMVALAKRIEVDYMSNWREDRTYVWFWRMIDSLGLQSYDDWSWDSYSENNPVDTALDRFMAGLYEPDGRGSLFIIKDQEYDCRLYEIWANAQKWIHDNMCVYNPEGIVKY